MLRGIRTRIEENDDATNKSGPLQECRWNLIQPNESIRDDETPGQLSRGADGLGILEGIEVEIVYEKATYNALMLRDPAAESNHNDGEMHLPLLLSRMPSATRELFLHYLSTTFDTHAEAMRFKGQFIGDALEAFVREAARDGARNAVKIIRDIQLKLAFRAPAQPALSSLDVMIHREDVQGFLEAGKLLSKTRPGQMESLASTKFSPGPFMSAIHEYLSTHLALNMSHDDIAISRVSCGAFALGREGKAKLFPPLFSTESDDSVHSLGVASREAMKKLLKLLLSTAIGNTQALYQESAEPDG